MTHNLATTDRHKVRYKNGVKPPASTNHIPIDLTQDRWSAIRGRYTFFQSDIIEDFLEQHPSAVAMLVEAIPQIDAIIANDPQVQLMLLSDQEMAPTLYARVLTQCSIDEALALSDKLDDLRWSAEASSASAVITFDIGIA
jgi:hypothetical protein